MADTFCVLFKKSLSTIRLWRYFPVFSSKNFFVLRFYIQNDNLLGFFVGLLGCLTFGSFNPWTMKARSPNHWTAREFPAVYLELIFIYGVRQWPQPFLAPGTSVMEDSFSTEHSGRGREWFGDDSRALHLFCTLFLLLLHQLHIRSYRH